MRNLKLWSLLLLLNFGLSAQVLHQYAKPIAEYLPELPQIPEGLYQDTILYFCTDLRTPDSLYYQYDSLGRLIAYSSVYPSAAGLIYADHRLSYEGAELKTWQRLPDQTNNGRSYYFSYDSLRRFQSLEVHNTGSFGSDFEYSVNIISRENNAEHYRFDYKNGLHKVRIDFKDTLGNIDSTWIQDTWSSSINKKFRYRTEINGLTKQVSMRAFYLDTTYYGHWFFPPGYEPGPFGPAYPIGTSAYSFLPQGGRLVQFVLDSIVAREKPIGSALYRYRKFGNWKLSEYQEKRSPAYYTYDSLGMLQAAQFPQEQAFYQWKHLVNPTTDSGRINSPCQGNCAGNIQIYKCSQNQMSSSESKQPDWQLYPNPSSGLLKLDFPAGIKSLSVLDASGKIYWQKSTVRTSLRLDLHHMPAGFYYVVVQVEGMGSQRKWLKTE